jgi:exonuclease V gamma subunit
MRIDLKQLAKVEKDYQGNTVAYNSLQTMMNTVLCNWDISPTDIQQDSVSISLQVAINTLRELKILRDEKDKPVQQLNS